MQRVVLSIDGGGVLGYPAGLLLGSCPPQADRHHACRHHPDCGRGSAAYGPHKTIYNRFIRWSRLGVFNRILAELAAQGGETDNLMIDATNLKAHRTAASLLKKGLYPDVSDAAEAA